MNKTRYFQLLSAAFLGGLLSLLFLFTYQNIFTKKEGYTALTHFDNSSIPIQLANFVPNLNPSDLDFTFAAEMTIHAVVHIRTEYQRKSTVYDDFFGHLDPFRDFFFRNPHQGRAQQPIIATGSGVIISPDGYIITNNHVVQEADFIEVTLNNKESFPAIIIGSDPSTDLALLKIESNNLPHIHFGNSDNVRIGEWVLAVGNPFNLNSTVTAGIVSAKARNINILGRQDAIESFIQTDAAVNRGNSGGALINTRGELIGINAAIASNTGSFTGYSFAIPVNIVRKVAKDLLEYGQVQRAYLGVEIIDMTSKVAQEKKVEKIPGVYVAGLVKNGSAEDGGLRAGDIITSIDNIKLNSASALLELIAAKSPGETVNVVYSRDGKTKEANIKLKNKYGNYNVIEKEKESIISLLGATFENASKEELKRLNLQQGVKVTSIEQGKLRNSGIREGFIITHIDKTPVKNIDDIYKILKSKKGGVLIEGIYSNGLRAYYGFGL